MKLNFLNNYKVSCLVILTILIANMIAAKLNFPNYGAWTGIRPLEEKLSKLEKFAENGDVDAIVLGPSISDFGFSAEYFSKLKSKQLGREYRVFNFSTGGAELSFLPNLYRIVLTITKPKAIFISIPVEFKRSEILDLNTPDSIMMNAPIGSSLKNKYSLFVSKLAWNIPIIKKSAAIRDFLLYGKFKNLIGQGMDTFSVTNFGDRISYIAGLDNIEKMHKLRREYEAWIRPSSDLISYDLFESQKFFFPNIDIQAMEKLKNLTQQDGIRIYILPHVSSAVVWNAPINNSDYIKASAQYFSIMAKSMGATLLGSVNNLMIPDFATMEGTHLNTYGSIIYTEHLFISDPMNKAIDFEKSYQDIEMPSIEPIRIHDPTFNTWSSVIIREEGEGHFSLRCRFVYNFAVPVLPNNDLYFLIRMPDGSDIKAPVRKVSDGEYEASLYMPRTIHKQGLILRLVHGSSNIPMSAPLSRYEWKKI